jgi:hypothetical protein
MNESLVQWTLLQNLDFLSKSLDFAIAKKIGQEITTDYGRIDFILEDTQQKQLIVELETILDTKNKRDYCFEQTKRYKNVRFSDNTDYCILYADETNKNAQDEIIRFGKNENVLIRKYSLSKAKELYTSTVERLSLNVGLALPNPKNYTMCYLRYLNKIIKPFADSEKNELFYHDIVECFKKLTDSKTNSETNFNCHKRLALDFEMITIQDEIYSLTNNGIDYKNNLNPNVFRTNNVSSIDLTNEQKRLLLKILTNGNWDNKVHKINIYWFLRFIEVTNGDWFPKNEHGFDSDKLEIVKSLFRVTYKPKTMQQFLNWCANYCGELGLAGRIVSTKNYDRLFLTPLGVEVNNIFSMDLLLKKSRMNLNFKSFGDD